MGSRAAIKEYVTGSLWVLPTISGVLALAVGWALSQITIGPDSALEPLAFEGTADDARSLLASVTSTVITVIALVLGLTVVALQLSTTQFSPRLLRRFLRDRSNQVVLSVFVATFVYSAAGLYTVGESGGERTQSIPRLAVSGSLLLLLACLAMVVYFADHLSHSIQIDAIGRDVERDTVRVVRALRGVAEVPTPEPPARAVPVRATESGYVQYVSPDDLLPVVRRHAVHLRLRPRIGEHVVAGTVYAWVWTVDPERPAPDPEVIGPALHSAVRLGFERTMEQDAAFGIRQLVDMACKALSPAVNDPYTAVQSVDRLSVIFCSLAVRPLGDLVLGDERGAVTIPARRFGDYLATACGLIRRYGASEPTLSLALLRLLDSCAAVLPVGDRTRWGALAEQISLILADADREIAQPADVEPVRRAASALAARVEAAVSGAAPDR